MPSAFHYRWVGIDTLFSSSIELLLSIGEEYSRRPRSYHQSLLSTHATEEQLTFMSSTGDSRGLAMHCCVMLIAPEPFERGRSFSCFV